jgi:hypothetical protein
MGDSERPSITGETKEQMKARHQRELKESGYTNRIKQWGAVAAAIVAIFSLGTLMGTRVWPWCVRAGIQEQLEVVRETKKVVDRLDGSVKEQEALLEAMIKAAGEQVHASALQDERLHSSVEALRNEVRLRHGVLDISDALGTIGLLGASGGGTVSGRGGGADTRSVATRAPAPRMSRQEQIRVVVERADEKLSEAKENIEPQKQESFQDAVKAQLAH